MAVDFLSGLKNLNDLLVTWSGREINLWKRMWLLGAVVFPGACGKGPDRLLVMTVWQQAALQTRARNRLSSARRVLARNIRQARLKAQLTPRAVERETGIPRSLLRKIEEGTAQPTLLTLGALARVVGQELSTLMGAEPVNACRSERAEAVSKPSPHVDMA